MSYSIYYARAFVSVGDKYIPLANSGSNNCFELCGGREIPEKNWGILNWKRPGQALFTENEIRAIAKDYDEYNQESGMIFKSRHRLFEPGEFERWVINGMRSAYTVEEYHSFGNRFYVLDYSPSDIRKWVKHPFSKTDELLDLLGELKATHEISIKMYNNRDVYRPVMCRAKGKSLNVRELLEYYILVGEGIRQPIQGRTVYFVKLTRTGFKYVHHKDSSCVKIFRTERDAARYIGKYSARLNPFAAFKPVRMVNDIAQSEVVSA